MIVSMKHKINYLLEQLRWMQLFYFGNTWKESKQVVHHQTSHQSALLENQLGF